MKLWIKIIVTMLAMIVISLSTYSLVMGEFGILPHTQLFAGLMLIIMGILAILEKQKVIGILAFLISGFVLFVSIDRLLS